MMKILNIRTNARTGFYEITRAVQEAMEAAGVTSGLCQVFALHTTAGITINEHADPSVMEDMGNYLDRLVPDQPYFRHAEGNSAAHIKSTLVGSSVTIPVENGRLALGTWQGVFFCEFDGPRQRKAAVTVVDQVVSSE